MIESSEGEVESLLAQENRATHSEKKKKNHRPERRAGSLGTLRDAGGPYRLSLIASSRSAQGELRSLPRVGSAAQTP